QRRGTYSAAVVKLNLIRLIERSNLTVPLQLRDFINERGMRPGLSGSSGLCVRDDVGRCLFDHAEPDELQLTDDRGLPRAGRAGYNEPSHVVSFSKTNTITFSRVFLVNLNSAACYTSVAVGCRAFTLKPRR